MAIGYFGNLLISSRWQNQPLDKYASYAAQTIVSGNASGIWGLASEREQREALKSPQNLERLLHVLGTQETWQVTDKLVFQGNDEDYAASASVPIRSKKSTNTTVVLDIYRGERGPFILPTFTLVTTHALDQYAGKFSGESQTAAYWKSLVALLDSRLPELEGSGVVGVMVLGEKSVSLVSWKALLSKARRMAERAT